MPVDFVLSNLTSSVTLSTQATIAQQVLSISGDATAVFFVRVNDMKNVFQFETDAVNINDLSSQDMKFYVNMGAWPSNYLPALNPANAMLDVPGISTGAISSVSGISSLPYDHNKQLVKHDFLRYVAQRMFNTYQAVDIFQNQLAVIQNIESVCDGSAPGRSWYDISAALHSVAVNGTHPGLLLDMHSEKYMTVATTSADNLCRELFLQIVGNAPTRFQGVGGAGSILNGGVRQPLLFESGDSINFNLTINAAPGQNNVNNLNVAAIPSRTYTIKIVMLAADDNTRKNSQTDAIIGNTISIDSVGKASNDGSTAATIETNGKGGSIYTVA
jgi:hypothetical protein